MTNKLYIRLDVDNAGDNIELALLKSNYNEAQNVHDNIQKNIIILLNKIKDINTTTILMKGCDDILFSIDKNNYELELLEKLKADFKIDSGFSLSIGVGITIAECILNLRIAKVSGKNVIVENNYS